MSDALAAVIPSIGVGLLFWFVVRSIIRADRSERAALAQYEREAAGYEQPVDPAEPDRKHPPERSSGFPMQES